MKRMVERFEAVHGVYDSDNGRWVRHMDYEALESRLDQANADAKEMRHNIGVHIASVIALEGQLDKVGREAQVWRRELGSATAEVAMLQSSLEKIREAVTAWERGGMYASTVLEGILSDLK